MIQNTQIDYDYEWKVTCETRLGIMCGNAEPTPKQIHIAKSEADETVAKLKRELTENGKQV